MNSFTAESDALLRLEGVLTEQPFALRAAGP